MRFEFKKARVNKKLTQKQLAEKAGMAVISVRKIESGERNPSLQTAVKLSYILSTKVEKLFPDIFLNKKDTKCIYRDITKV
ncbi:helix-turn-helix transcriptional regulator [Listeria aquatica]|uniref:helix-turn-helix transcriptional regulator n=1 Tax=Listeria aquatica TaxID=1494960 RepID=UPI0031F552E9